MRVKTILIGFMSTWLIFNQNAQAQENQQFIDRPIVNSVETAGIRPAAARPIPRSFDEFGAPAFDEGNRIEAVAPNVEKLLDEDSAVGSGPVRAGVVLPVQCRSDREGRWVKLDDGGWLWTVSFQSLGASALQIRLGDWQPVEGTELLVYSPDGLTEIQGPFGRNTARYRTNILWTPAISGDVVHLEYYVPAGVDHLRADVQLVIDSVMYIYRNSQMEAGGGSGTPLPCHLDVSCFPSWAFEARAVAVLYFINDGFGFFCSGALLNRTAQDFTPLFMTATHCDVSGANVQNLVVVWNFETTSCNGTAPNWWTLPSTAGVTVLVSDVSTDWTIVGLANNIPLPMTYLGWNANFWNNDLNAAIHHPRGSFKRISFGDHNGDNGFRPDPGGGMNCIAGSSWEVDFLSGNGLVEGGSSGSPIFDSASLVRGTLSCGSATCNGTSNASYGRLDQAWSLVQPFLDPEIVVYVDSNFNGQELGTVGNPFDTVIEGVYAVPASSFLIIQAGTYNSGGLTITKGMILSAFNGTVTIN